MYVMAFLLLVIVGARLATGQHVDVAGFGVFFAVAFVIVLVAGVARDVIRMRRVTHPGVVDKATGETVPIDDGRG